MGEQEDQKTEPSLEKAHRDILNWIADRTDESMPEPGITTSVASYADAYNVWVHWQTAGSLRKRGLIRYPNGWDPEYGYGIALTAAGWASIGRTSPFAGSARGDA